MLVNTNTGRMDLTSRMSANINPANVNGGDTDKGFIRSQTTADVPGVSAPPVYGRFYPSPPGSVKVELSLIPGVPDRYFWIMPDGSELPLAMDDVLNDVGWWFAPGRYDADDARIKLSAATYPGFVAYSMIGANSNGTPSLPPPAPQVEHASAWDAISKGSGAIIVIALVGAAIYFLPRGLLKGGAA